MIEIVAFDADDTLWHNEPLYARTTTRFRELLSSYHSSAWIDERLSETELRNLRHYGYGIKSFSLSMIETAIELTEGRIKGDEIGEILSLAKEMLAAPVQLLQGVTETITELARSFRLVLVTKGDLFDQESKIARSGLGDCFSEIEIVSDKDKTIYAQIALRNRIEPKQLVMVGDSLRSDVIPAMEAGCLAIHVPYETPWQHEVLPDEVLQQYRFLRASSIEEVPRLIKRLHRTAG